MKKTKKHHQKFSMSDTGLNKVKTRWPLNARIFIVTGTPGTGKTTVAKQLAKKYHGQYLDVNAIIRKQHLKEGYDRKRKTALIDTDKLNTVLIGIIKEAKKKKEILVIDSHLSHYLPAKWVDLCIVTKTNLKKLKQRLQRRGYSKAKIQENLECEIFDVCLTEAEEAGQRVKVVGT